MNAKADRVAGQIDAAIEHQGAGRMDAGEYGALAEVAEADDTCAFVALSRRSSHPVAS